MPEPEEGEPTAPSPDYVLVRFVFLRLLALVYLVAFLIAANQAVPLIGAHGLEPASDWLRDVAHVQGSRVDGFFEIPSIFWIDVSDTTLAVTAWIGVVLALAALAGVTHAALQLALWFLQISFVHVGQTFWGYGWEMLLCEAGFLAIFLCPFRSLVPFPKHAPPIAPIWLLRWCLFRLMFGAGLIKLRGDPCWVELTCLEHHYETQPNPSPISWLLHALPPWLHAAGVLFNHVVELVAPFGVLVPSVRPAAILVRRICALLIIAFQLILIVSGNLSFLNWLTLAVGIAALDDAFLARVVPRARRFIAPGAVAPASPVAQWVSYFLVAVVVLFSFDPLFNMLSSRQVMNTSYDRFHMVNTYGAFGSVSRERHEVVLEGTRDATLSDRTRWREYELPCKPGDPGRAPCLITPYHYRLDWQMWFAALSDYEHEPWIVNLAWKLLRGERTIRTLLAHDPFPRHPPRHVRALLYHYRFRAPGEAGQGWWIREERDEYLRPLSLQDPELREFVRARDWQ